MEEDETEPFDNRIPTSVVITLPNTPEPEENNGIVATIE
jgi:hypothetical protein